MLTCDSHYSNWENLFHLYESTLIIINNNKNLILGSSVRTLESGCSHGEWTSTTGVRILILGTKTNLSIFNPKGTGEGVKTN